MGRGEGGYGNTAKGRRWSQKVVAARANTLFSNIKIRVNKTAVQILRSNLVSINDMLDIKKYIRILTRISFINGDWKINWKKIMSNGFFLKKRHSKLNNKGINIHNLIQRKQIDLQIYVYKFKLMRRIEDDILFVK